MASSVALRRLAGKDLLSGNIFRPLRSLSSTRAFNTNTQMARVVDDDGDDRSSISRRRDFPTGILPDVFDPFAPTRSVSQLMNFMDQLMENSASRMGLGGGGGAMKRGWDVKEDNEALRLKVDMPGLGKEDVKVSVEENTLIIKGEAEKETEEMEDRRRYSTRIDLSPNMYKVDGIKAEMKNGVLKIVLPKLKPEERKDVFQVQIE